MFELTVRDDFSSAHFLRDYDGQCKNLHGHTWKVAVTVSGTELDKVGVMADFVKMKAHLKSILSRLDHACLNDLDFFKANNPTAENLAQYIYREYKPLIAPVRLVKVRVWESDKADV
ncbi:MAG: 6-carboxytetrahydropterin synthase QueD, partial [Candidatus Omnitrophica bacterium]|nr:6-carboxytetrahydropterin synthase QueD [Candidatus Omnitrophota bacterium]